MCVRYARSLTAHMATSNGRKHAKQRLPHAESHPKPASTTHKHPQGQPFGPAQINLTFNFSSLAHSLTLKRLLSFSRSLTLSRPLSTPSLLSLAAHILRTLCIFVFRAAGNSGRPGNSRVCRTKQRADDGRAGPTASK